MRYFMTAMHRPAESRSSHEASFSLSSTNLATPRARRFLAKRIRQ
jgi:hypothetical protein